MPIITSRTRTMDQETFSLLTGIVKSLGYDLSDLSLTPQP